MAKKPSQKKAQLGHLPPQHDFFLNPYSDARFTRCPKCDRATKLRKKPLLIFIDMQQPVLLNKTCRYCPDCDLLIAHKDQLDELLAALCLQHFPDLVGKEYFVLGTMERKDWKEGILEASNVFESVHDFKQQLNFEPARYMWVKND
jgi:phage terminase large subunit GpA-like protein